MPFERVVRFAARYPAFWTALAALCFLAMVLLAALLLWPAPVAQHPLSSSAGERKHSLKAQEPPPAPRAPENASSRAGLAIVMDDLGENMQAVHALLALRIPFGFAIWPHARFARETARAAHAAGLAVLVHQPMEPLHARARPGPNPLYADMSRERMEAVFRGSLASVPHAEGVNNHMGSRFTSRPEAVRLFCEIVADSGLFVLDSVTHPASVLYKHAQAVGIPAARREIFLDAAPGKNLALAQLREATRLALHGKQVVAIGHPRADTLAALREWNNTRDPRLRLLSPRECLSLPDPPAAQPRAQRTNL